VKIVRYTVKEVAEISGVSVRTLHHYHSIGLLKPDRIAENGYRFYSNGDLVKLERILFFKEMDFSLSEIKKIMNNPVFDSKEELMIQKDLLQKKKERLERIINLLDSYIKSKKEEIVMADKESFKAFAEDEIEKYKDEVSRRYKKEVVQESYKKTSKYSEIDWKNIFDKGEKIWNEMILIMGKGHEDPQIQNLVNEYFLYINDSFYTCSLEIFSGLADLYVQDERFTTFYDKFSPGFAFFVSKAIKFYCTQKGLEE